MIVATLRAEKVKIIRIGSTTKFAFGDCIAAVIWLASIEFSGHNIYSLQGSSGLSLHLLALKENLLTFVQSVRAPTGGN